jgi:hypothetical protein
MQPSARVGHDRAGSEAPASAGGVPSGRARTLPERALALQRLAGNRAAARILARWVKHPDPDKKGVMVPDVAAEDHARFNPPQNK